MRAGRVDLPALGKEGVYHAAIYRDGLAHNVVTCARRKVDGHARHVLVITDAARWNVLAHDIAQIPRGFWFVWFLYGELWHSSTNSGRFILMVSLN